MRYIKGRCEPARSIVRRLGGVSATASIIGVYPSSVSRWMTKDGTAGMVPQKHWKDILKHAAERNIKITLEDLLG